jgi:hypothetical protein
MASYPESTIRAAVAARLHQGMDEEQVDAVEQEVRAEFAAEPPIEPMAPLRVAARKAGGWLSTDGRRDREAFRLATQGAHPMNGSDVPERRWTIWLCPECERIEGPSFGLQPEAEPVVCNQHMRGLDTSVEIWDGFPVMQEIEVIPARPTQPAVPVPQEGSEGWPEVWVRFDSRPALPPEASREPLTDVWSEASKGRRYMPSPQEGRPEQFKKLRDRLLSDEATAAGWRSWLGRKPGDRVELHGETERLRRAVAAAWDQATGHAFSLPAESDGDDALGAGMTVLKELKDSFMEAAGRNSRNHKRLTEPGRSEREIAEGLEAKGRQDAYLDVAWWLGKLDSGDQS